MKYLTLSIMVLLAACGGSGEESDDAETVMVEDTHPMMERMDLTEYGFPFSIWVPSSERTNTDPSSEFDDSFMHLKIVAGTNFQMIIRQEPAMLDRLKMTLENDILRTHEYLTDEPQLLVYKSTYPDEELSSVHFYYAFEVNGEPYVAEDVKEVDLDETAVQEMLRSLRDLELPV